MGRVVERDPRAAADGRASATWRCRATRRGPNWIYGVLASFGLALVLRMLLAVGMPQFLMFAIVAPYQVWLVVSGLRFQRRLAGVGLHRAGFDGRQRRHEDPWAIGGRHVRHLKRKAFGIGLPL